MPLKACEPRSRRAAASTTHDTGDCTGDWGSAPKRGFTTESSPALDAAGWAAIAGATTDTAVAAGALLIAATGVRVMDDSAAGPGEETVTDRASTEALVNCWGSDGVGSTAFNVGVESRVAVDASAVGAFTPLRDADGTDVDPAPTELEEAAPARPRLRTDDRGVDAPAESEAESPEVDGSAGDAHAVAGPPMVTAIPIPRATARPPTRPTQADARILKSLPHRWQGHGALYLKNTPEMRPDRYTECCRQTPDQR